MSADKVITPYLPLYSPSRRDCFWVWEYLIAQEDELLALGYKELTIGPHNFDKLFSISLENNAFKCLLVLVKYYQQTAAATQAAEAEAEERKEGEISLDVDLVTLLGKALTVNRVPRRIVCQLYDLLKADAKRKGPLSQEEKRLLLVAYCASVVPLLDTLGTGSEAAPAKKRRYQEKDPDEHEFVHPDYGSSEEEEESKENDAARVASMLNELMEGLECVPPLAVKFCCRYGRTTTLARILEQFPYLHSDGGAYGTDGAAAQEGVDCLKIFGDDEHY